MMRLGIERAGVALLTGSLGAGAVSAQSVRIELPDRRDHAYDPTSGLLYVSTSSGLIERFDVRSGSFLSPLSAGASLNGLAITDHGGYIYAAEGVRGPVQGFIRKIDTATGARTNLAYDLGGGEGGAWDIAIASNGRALFSARYEGSGWIELREILLATDEINLRYGGVRQDTHIAAGADRTLLFFMESNSSAGPTFTYDAATDTFPTSAGTGTSLSGAMSSVNRDGTLIAMELRGNLTIVDPQLQTVEVFTGLQGGNIFDPRRDILYAVDDVRNEVVAIATDTWAQMERFPIGEDVDGSSNFAQGVMSISADASRLFLSVPGGIRVIDNPVACAADCDGDRELTFFDFLCFQDLFSSGSSAADCDKDGILTFFDFLCFQDEFSSGRP